MNKFIFNLSIKEIPVKWEQKQFMPYQIKDGNVRLLKY